MTQVKLWQIVSQTANAIIFSDADGNLKTLPTGSNGQVLISGPDGAPMWAENAALLAALQAQTDAGSALAAAKAYTEAQIAALVDNAPVALNTLNELAVKLNGEDSAINALLLQVDGKAEKTEVATQIAQAKQDAIQTAQENTTVAVANALNTVDSQIAATRSEILTSSMQFSESRANSARDEAILVANDFTTQAVAQAKTEASDDATAKADVAQTAAITAANAYTDGEVANALNIASADAQGKVNDAISAASDDATHKVDSLRDAIPGMFWTEGTSTACFVANAQNLNMEQATGAGLIVSQDFAEVTGAAVIPNDPFLKAKLLFVNGVAMAEDWTASTIGNNQLVVKLGQPLAQHVFDGSKNALMLLVEYKSYNAISRIS